MTMESVLKQLETKIDEFVKVHDRATAKTKKLEARVAELEKELESSTVADERIEELEKQRDDMAERLEKVLSHIDAAMELHAED